ncbi:MAG: mechanosensitive ion channel family protein [Longimicrobiales bacterium]|jgi:small-conductance mechanosensitive channel
MIIRQEVLPESNGLVPGVDAATETNIILSLLVVLLIFFVRRAVLAVVHGQTDDAGLRYRWAKLSATVGFGVTVLLLVQIWFTAIRSIGTFLGLLSAGLAIALKDIVTDLAGWIFIMWRRPFDLGDRIQIGAHAGDVVDRSLFQFTIMEIGNWVSADQSTGRLIHIPNAKVFTEPLANYVAGFPYLWNELRVEVTFESNWRRAKMLLEELAKDHTVDLSKEEHRGRARDEQRFLIRYRKLTPVVYVSVADSGVELTLRYLCRPRERRGSASTLWERVLDAFDQHPDVTLAYPTQRVNLAREVLSESSDPARPGQEEGSLSTPGS